MLGIKINKKVRNILIAILVIILVFVLFSLFPDKNFRKKYEGIDLSTSAVSSHVKSYTEYQDEFEGAKSASSIVNVDIFAYDSGNSYGVHDEENYYNKKVVFTDDKSYVSWNVNVEEEGLYNIEMEYIATPSRNVDMERILYINGAVPFSGADVLSFSRLWKDEGDVKYDNQGNQIRPVQVESFAYQTVRYKSDLGYEIDPYKFYLKKGMNTLSLESTNEPMVISSLRLVPVKKYDTYDAYVAKYPAMNASNSGKDIKIKIQGEDSALRSDPSLFARYDRSSAISEPYNVKTTVLNYSGGDSWKSPGQWIEWDFDVPEDGWYTITVQGRQLYQRGSVSCRSLYIDGEIPISDVKAIEFKYNTDWKSVTVCDSEKQPYNFYLSKGNHSIRLEATLGEIGSVVSQLQDSIYRLNVIYRTILVLTSSTPDQFRDYEIEKVYPNEVEAMLLESKRLYKLIDDYVQITGQKSDKIAIAETLAIQLEEFYNHPEKITKAFSNFKDNVTSLGGSLQSITEIKLDVDFVLVQSAGTPIKAKKSNFFLNAKHEILSFFTSFFVDSSSLGNVYDKNDDNLIEVWIVTGRDQSTILKNMIDDSFTPVSGVGVNVKLIDINALLNAVVAGNGPDVVISSDCTKPVDYALRNADVNLMRFDDCEKILGQFNPSAYEAYKYDGGVYALPETETVNLMFYRKDILEQLGLEVPQTWEQLIEILPTLQGNNLTVGAPYPNIQLPDMSTFYSMIYQKGGRIYNDKGTKSLVDSEQGIESFKTYTSLFNSYGLPTVYDFVSRFRSGEMPIGIANYSTYNTLIVSAPEIRGLWDFTYLPGTERTDSSGKKYIDRSTAASGVCCMMIKKGPEASDYISDPNAANMVFGSVYGNEVSDELAPNIDERTWREIKQNEKRMSNSWEFMKWWVSSDIQVRFGREIEALLGSSARYATANIDSLRQLSWNSAQLEILVNSLDESVGLPEVPGSYYTPRHIVNGTRKVINEKNDAREVLIDYTRKINEELTRKRQEFNLPTE